MPRKPPAGRLGSYASPSVAVAIILLALLALVLSFRPAAGPRPAPAEVLEPLDYIPPMDETAEEMLNQGRE